MSGNEIAELFERLSRLVDATKKKAGDGAAWNYTFPDGTKHRYIIRGIKSLEEVQDNAFNLIIWIWSAKDYLKERAIFIGMDRQCIEKMVNNNQDMLICGDLANRLKHGGLKNSRSGQFPRLGKVSFEATQEALGGMVFKAFEVEIQISEPRLIQFRLPVYSKNGNEMGDAFQYAQKAIAALEKVRDTVEQLNVNFQ